VRLRDKMTYGSRPGKMLANLRASIGVAMNPPTFEVEFSVEGRRERMEVSAISVANNSFGASPYLIPDAMDGGHLGLYLAEPLTPRGAMALAYDILRGRLTANAAIRQMTVQAVDLHFPRHRHSARCVIDGELLPLPADVSLRIHAGELKLLTRRA